MEIQLAHRLRIWAYSGSSPRTSTGRAMTCVARSRLTLRGLVRPLTRMYSGTSRPADSSSSPSHTSCFMSGAKWAVGLCDGPCLGAEILADPGHQAAHLVGDGAHVDRLLAQDGQPGVLAG